MICEICGKKDASLHLKEKKAPFRELLSCQNCYDQGKELAYKDWEAQARDFGEVFEQLETEEEFKETQEG